MASGPCAAEIDRHRQAFLPLRRADAVLQHEIEASGFLRVRRRIDGDDIDPRLPSAERLPDVVHGEARGGVVVRREREPLKIAPVVGPHNPLAGAGRHQKQNGLAHGALLLHHLDAALRRDVQPRVAFRPVEVRMLEFPCPVARRHEASATSSCPGRLTLDHGSGRGAVGQAGQRIEAHAMTLDAQQAGVPFTHRQRKEARLEGEYQRTSRDPLAFRIRFDQHLAAFDRDELLGRRDRHNPHLVPADDDRILGQESHSTSLEVHRATADDHCVTRCLDGHVGVGVQRNLLRGQLEVAAIGVLQPNRPARIVDLQLVAGRRKERAPSHDARVDAVFRRAIQAIHGAQDHALRALVALKEHQNLIADVGKGHESLPAAGAGGHDAHPLGLDVGEGRQRDPDPAERVGVVDPRDRAPRAGCASRGIAARRRCGRERRDEACAPVDSVRGPRQHIRAGERWRDAPKRHARARHETHISVGTSRHRDLGGRPSIELGLRDGFRLPVIGRHHARERPIVQSADASRCDGRRDVARSARLRHPRLVRLDPSRVPARHDHGLTGAIAVDLDAYLEQRLSQNERQRLPGSCKREQVKHVIPQRRVQPAAVGDLHEHIEIRLARLNHPAPRRSGIGGGERDAEVGGQLPREIGGADLHMRTNRLALAQAVQQVVAPHADLKTPRGTVVALDGG